jgi:hypothetical protein
MKQQHKDFLESNIGDYHRLQLKYAKNLTIEKLKMYEEIYREYISKTYILTKWCSDCVYDCMESVWRYYLNLGQQIIQADSTLSTDKQTDNPIEKKKGRPKKSANK